MARKTEQPAPVVSGTPGLVHAWSRTAGRVTIVASVRPEYLHLIRNR